MFDDDVGIHIHRAISLREQTSTPGGVGVFDPLPQVPLPVFLGSP